MFRLFVLVVLIVHTTSIVSVTADSISSFKNPWAEHNAKMMAKSTNTINKETVGASCTVDTDCNAANVETCCSGFCVQLSGRACCGDLTTCPSGNFCCSGGGCAVNGNTVCSSSGGVCSSCSSGYNCNGDNCVKSSCFASTETVELKNGQIKALSDVELGDSILTASLDGKNTQFSEVVAMPHGAGLNDVKATFVHIQTSSGRGIKMTLDHLVLAKTASESTFHLVQAGTLVVGQYIATIDTEKIITSIDLMVQKGISTVVTSTGGLIVVNGIIASPFAVNHDLADSFYNIHRVVYYFSPKVLASTWIRDAVNMFAETIVNILS